MVFRLFRNVRKQYITTQAILHFCFVFILDEYSGSTLDKNSDNFWLLGFWLENSILIWSKRKQRKQVNKKNIVHKKSFYFTVDIDFNFYVVIKYWMAKIFKNWYLLWVWVGILNILTQNKIKWYFHWRWSNIANFRYG